MDSGVGQRIEDFHNVYRALLAGLSEVGGTANGVPCPLSSGTAAIRVVNNVPAKSGAGVAALQNVYAAAALPKVAAAA
ncbi:MAG: hypothetical protein ABSF98_27235 [Bryobacteraceae bacterium]|jgi:hypothetical protein